MKNFKITKKLGGLLILQVITLIAAYLLILFFYQQNMKQQQANASVQLNHTLLSNTKHAVNTLHLVTQFPIYRATYKFEDPLYQFLIKHKSIQDYPGEFETVFDRRTTELILQFPVIESIRLYDVEGKSLARKLTSLYYVPYEEFLPSALFERIASRKGSLYYLTQEDLLTIGYRPSENLLYTGRILKSPMTFKPLCIVITGININDIFVDFKKQKQYTTQRFGVYHNNGTLLFADSDLLFDSIPEKDLKSGSSTLTQVHNKITYEYYINYDESKEIYSVIESPLPMFYRSEGISYQFFNGVMLLITIMILLTSIIIIYSINRPLSRLVKACQKIGTGDFSTRIENTSSDELGYLTTSFNHMSEKVEKLINEVYLKSITERDLELQMLRSQINPHFLYNTLESMRMAAYAQGALDLAEMCRLLANVLRYGVSKTNHLVSVTEELEHLQDYNKLLAFRFHNDITIHLHADHLLKEYRIIKLLLQPLVENCINHGIPSSDRPGEIQIWAYRQEKHIIFTVTDNGNGMTKDRLHLLRDYIDNKNTAFQSIGLKNIHRRIKLYYGEQYGLTIDSKLGRGTSVSILLPIIDKENLEKEMSSYKTNSFEYYRT